MIEKTTSKEMQGLSLEELEAHTGEYLPDREEMSMINTNIYAPTNTALALNLFSDNSTAYANAEQNNYVAQNNFEQNKFEQNDFDKNGYQYGHEKNDFDNNGYQYGHMKGAEMSSANANVYAPTNTAVAANVASDNSLAYANAEQNNFVEQGNFEQNNFMKNHR